MKKILTILAMLLLLVGCSDDELRDWRFCENFDCTFGGIQETSSVPPTNTSTTNSTLVLNTKALTYIEASYRAGSAMYDTHGLIVSRHADGTAKGQGDALLFNSISLSAMCLIDFAVTKGTLNATFDMTTDLTALWTSYKTMQSTDGRLSRHPIYSTANNYTTISKDMLTGFYYLGAMAHKYNCEPIKSEYGAVIRSFADYAIANNWEAGVGVTNNSQTKMTGRHLLYSVMTLYGLDTSNLDLATSIYDLKTSAKYADYINENKYWCRSGYAAGCLKIANAGVFGNNLIFLSMEIATATTALHSTADIKSWYYYLGKVGGSIGLPNWKFVTGYRNVNGITSVNDAENFLNDKFPTGLPKENNAIADWGCAEYIWQRVPYEPCSSSDNTTYPGDDFLLMFGMMRAYQ